MATKAQLLQSYMASRYGKGSARINYDKDPEYQSYVQQEEEARKARQQAIQQGLNKKMSWEDISEQTGVPLQSVENYSKRTNPNYGVDTRSNIDRVRGVNDTIGGAVTSVLGEVTGQNKRQEQQFQEQNKLLNRRKKAIRESKNLSDDTKSEILGRLTQQQRDMQAKFGQEVSSDIQSLDAVTQNPVVQAGANVGTGFARGGAAIMQGVGGLYDIATPGKGQSRLTQYATKSAELQDQFSQNMSFDPNMAKQNEDKIKAIVASGVLTPETKKQMIKELTTNKARATANKATYTGGQLLGEAVQLLGGAEAVKLFSYGNNLLKSGKVFELGKGVKNADRIAEVLQNSGTVGKVAIKGGKYIFSPARVANIAGNVAVDQGQLSGRGEDINAGTIATSAGLNYALGGILDAASAGLSRRATGKASKADDLAREARDLASEADNIAFNKSIDGSADELAGQLPTRGQRQLPMGSTRKTTASSVVDDVAPKSPAPQPPTLSDAFPNRNPFNPKELLVTDAKNDPIAGLEVYIRGSGKDRQIVLNNVRALEPGNGAGTEALTKLKKYADDTNTPIVGDVKPTGTAKMNTKQLTDWYKKNGFEVDSSRNLQYKPKTVAPVEAPALKGETRGVFGGAQPEQSDIQRLATVQKKIARAQKQGGLAPDEARSLMRERTELLDKIQNPEKYVTPTTTPAPKSSTVGANVEQPKVTGDIPTGNGTTKANLSAVSDKPGTTKYSGTALKTEQKAIEEHLVEEFKDKATYSSTSYRQDAIDATNLVKNDRAKAESIAFAEIPGNNPSHEVAVKKALELEAFKNKDANTLQRIAQSDVNSRTSEAAQRLGAEGYNKNPESPVETMKQVLAARKASKLKGLNKELTADESARITRLADEVAIQKAKTVTGQDNTDYGEALVNLRRYKNELIDASKSKTEKIAPKGFINATAGTAKSLKASLDNSFFGRQGLKVLTTHPTKWADAFVKSWGDVGKGLRGKNALDSLDAITLGKANSINGRYAKMKLDLHTTEEAFPSSLPEKIPALGRLFKASEYAYTGGAHRMRADLADQLLEKAQKAGVDIDDPEQLEKMGKLVNSMTGRGHLGKAEVSAAFLNNLFFSPRNWKSNLDTITAHQFQKGTNVLNRDPAAKFVRKEATKNLAKMVAVTASVLALADKMVPGSVERDPRSSDFGKIKIGNTRFDITGGHASIATVATRLATLSSKSTTTGRTTKLNSDAFGSRSGWDVLTDYAEGKMSPTTQAVKQLLSGKTFTGDKVTPATMLTDTFAPLPITNYFELRDDPKSANALVAMIADGLGVGTNTYGSQKDWNRSTGKTITGFKKSVDNKTFVKANNEFNEEFSEWQDKVRKSSVFKDLSDDAQAGLIKTKANRLTKDILKRYNYTYKSPKKSSTEKNTNKRLLGL